MTLKSKASSKILGTGMSYTAAWSLAHNSQNGPQCAALGAKGPHRENGQKPALKIQLLTPRSYTGNQT